ncbi:TetR/AcrR family transcriptional regulator [Rhodococcus sp. NPDC127528]|uniref:TetR/AcrR family transcriptional regulator n=1 Tax=unclassified Rhodococcus (in: high G+C Gram-positive bacteria) TaxID=192944 RepID=UPI0036383E6D
MIAATELMAESGYRGVGVRQIAARAKVSQVAFYQCFPDKDSCVFAAYDRFIEVLIVRIREILPTTPTDWDRQVITSVVAGYLGALDADPVVAQAFQVEMDALGRPARARRRTALVGMAQVLKSERERLWPEIPRPPLSAYVGAVYAVRQLASDVLDDPEGGSTSDLAAEAGLWIEAMFSASPD